MKITDEQDTKLREQKAETAIRNSQIYDRWRQLCKEGNDSPGRTLEKETGLSYQWIMKLISKMLKTEMK